MMKSILIITFGILTFPVSLGAHLFFNNKTLVLTNTALLILNAYFLYQTLHDCPMENANLQRACLEGPDRVLRGDASADEGRKTCAPSKLTLGYRCIASAASSLLIKPIILQIYFDEMS
ncbi:hypothetical protein [Rhodospirillum sp. A1_3_36]|uniref:hypothetical protein n=1 Tax=Rhodospirillum sp. A1_3_36 TaxID=3391666 RepID=UPI0039A4E6CF